MTISLHCSGCGAQLELADEHAGKVARCPACGATTTVPAAPPPARVTGPPPQLDWMQPEWSPSAMAPPILPSAPPAGSNNPYVSPAPVPGGGRAAWNQSHAPHHGALVLTLGILGLIIALPSFLSLCCLPLAAMAPVAWVLGASDLKQIRAGRMDPSGEGTTRAGMIMGIIGTVFMALGAIFQVVIVIIAIAMDHH